MCVGGRTALTRATEGSRGLRAYDHEAAGEAAASSICPAAGQKGQKGQACLMARPVVLIAASAVVLAALAVAALWALQRHLVYLPDHAPVPPAATVLR